MAAQLKDEPLTMEEFMNLLQRYPVVRNSNYAPEAAPQPPALSTPKADTVDSDQAHLLEQALKEFTIEQRTSTAGKDFYTELTALALRYMTPADANRFIQAFREEHAAFISSLTPLEARRMREDLAKKRG